LTERLFKAADELAHRMRMRPDSWLVGAFLVLFGVAISAAIPQISAAVRSAVADAAKNGPGADAAHRPGLRIRLLAVRLVEPKTPGNLDGFVPHSIFAFVAVPQAALPATALDVAQQIRALGINVRAPPALRA
jgi:hypothetical protein